MVQQVKPSLGMPHSTSHTRVSFQASVAVLVIHLLAYVPGKAEVDGPNTWFPITHVRNSMQVFFFFFKFYLNTIPTVERDACPCGHFKVRKFQAWRKFGGAHVLVFFFFSPVSLREEKERATSCFQTTSVSGDGRQIFDDILEIPL